MRSLQVAYPVLATFRTRQAIFEAFNFESSVLTTPPCQLTQVESRSCWNVTAFTIQQRFVQFCSGYIQAKHVQRPCLIVNSLMSECLITGLFILTEECKCLSQRLGFVFCCAAVGLAGTRNEKTKIDQRRVNLLSDLPVGLHAGDVVLMQACVC